MRPERRSLLLRQPQNWQPTFACPPRGPTKRGLSRTPKTRKSPTYLRAGLPAHLLTRLRLRLAEVCLTAGINRGRQRILFANRDILAALDQFIGAFAKLSSFALGVILAFIGF